MLRKITVRVSDEDLRQAQELTGEGVSETVRAGLRKLAAMQAQQAFRKLRGTFQFTIDIDALREDRT
jgi:Arc/MetJ-type ribon-helix-helix transcriptional regulator